MQDVKDTHEDVEAAPQATDSEKVTADQEGDKTKEQPKPKVPFCALYRYATTSDMVQVCIGFLGSGLMGAIMPAFAVVFGDVLDELATADDVAEAVILPVILYACVAVASWLFSGLGHALLGATAETMTARIRKEYFRALLRNDMKFHDLED
ncbi:abcB2, partial [Symbiodinium sp. KB8]